MTTQNNAAQPVLTDTQIENIRIRAEKDSRRFGRTVNIPLQADLLLALLSKLRAPVPDGKRPDLDWIEGVRVTDTVGRGWCVRIDGTDIFEDANRYGCKGRKSFQIASGLSNKQEAERAALEWLDRQRAALASAPVAGEAVAWAVFAPNGNIRYWHHDKANVEAFAAKHGLPVTGIADAAPQASEADIIEDVAKQWDGCIYDAGPGGDIDIGKAIRNAASKHKGHRALKSTPAPTVAEDADDVALPPVPSAYNDTGSYIGYAKSDLRAYARAAVLADRRERAGKDDMLTIAYLAGAQAEKERAAVLAGRRERAEDDLPAFMQSRMTPWGLLVQACRIVVGTTLMDMSRELGIRPSSLSSYEHGRKGLNDHFVIEVMRFFEDRGLCIPATSWRKAAIAATQAEQGERDAG